LEVKKRVLQADFNLAYFQDKGRPKNIILHLLKN
jgi:hypothetical protein